MKVRKLLLALRSAGCAPLRQKGSHQVWRTPGGAVFTLVVNHPGVEVPRYALVVVRRALEAEGLSLARRGKVRA